MPPPGALGAPMGAGGQRLSASPPNPFPEPDTSYVCVADRWGNIFSATPSDGSYGSPVVPGVGFIPSNRGSQSRPDPRHPAGAAPGKRPRLTPNPALAIKGNGAEFLPFGTPGGDVQTQAMLQVLLNILVHGRDGRGPLVATPRGARPSGRACRRGAYSRCPALRSCRYRSSSPSIRAPGCRSPALSRHGRSGSAGNGRHRHWP